MKKHSKKRRSPDPLHEATTIAIRRVIDPLLDLMFDAGVTVQELNQIIRERAVRNATKRVIRESGRESRSRVAIATGVPRAEVAKILGLQDKLDSVRRGQHPVRRVLAAWYEDSRFLARDGEPAALPIFGKLRSFEHLVSMYSGGTPVRAMLDELTRIGAVERLANQQVRAKSRVPILTGLNAGAIAMVGERGGDLLDTLVQNVRRRSPPLFEATAVVGDADPRMIAMVQREIGQYAASFINGINSLLNRSRIKSIRGLAPAAKGRRLGVTVYYFEEANASPRDLQNKAPERRTNLRRRIHNIQTKHDRSHSVGTEEHEAQTRNE